MGSRVCARLGVAACDRVRAHVRAFSPTGSPVYLGAEVVAVVALFRDDLPCEALEPGIIIVQCTQRVGTAVPQRPDMVQNMLQRESAFSMLNTVML